MPNAYQQRQHHAEQIDDFIDQWREIAAAAVQAEHRLLRIRPGPRQQDLYEAFTWCKRVGLNGVGMGMAAAACFAAPTPQNRLAFTRYDPAPSDSELLTLPADRLGPPIVARLHTYDSQCSHVLASFDALLRLLDSMAPRHPA